MGGCEKQESAEAAVTSGPLTPGWAVFMTAQMVLWASSYPGVAIATGTGGLSGIELTILRATVATVLLTPVWWNGWRTGSLPPTADIWRILGWGAWYFAAALICFNTSIALGRPELSGILFAGFPIMLAAMAALLRVEPWDARAVPYVLLSLAGALLVVTGGNLRQIGVLGADLQATGLMLLAMLLIARYALGAKKLLATYPPLQFTAIALTGGALALLPLGVLLGGGAWTKPLVAPLPVLVAALYLILVATVLTEWMSMTGLRRLPVLVVGVFNYLQPPLIVLFTLLLPGAAERIGWSLIAGALCILCGASAVGTMQPDRPPWPEAVFRRLVPGTKGG